jgi:flagellar motor protein MotB
MSKHNRDVKFIIYQVLYIFVIVVLTMKGADINLEKVLTEEDAVKKTYADSLKKYIDSMLALGLVPKIELDSLRNIADLKNFVAPIIPQPVVTGVLIQPGNVQISQEEYQKIKEKEKEEPKQEIANNENIVLPTVPLVQFTKNSLKNNGSSDLQILGDGSLLATIPPGQSGTFQVMGQKTITYKQGGQSRNVNTRENQKPEVTIQTFKAGGEEASLRELQSIIGFRVTIKDDYPQYKVTISGPVKFEDKGNGVYDIKLFYAGSKSEFENRTGNMESPFRATFNVTVKDEIAGHTVSRSGQYTFGDW